MGIKRMYSSRSVRWSKCSIAGGSSSPSTVDADALERFLRFTVSTYSRDADLSAMARSESNGLARRLQTLGVEGCADEASNVLDVLSSFLALSVPTVPSSVVYEVHVLAGQLREAQNNYDGAARSYLKAAWIASSSEELRREQLALTLHRLGTVYGHLGNYLQAKQLLNNAIATYETANFPKDHPYLVDARQASRENESKYWGSDSSWSIRSHQRLSFIAEEPVNHRSANF